MDMHTKTRATKPEFREMAEKGTAQAKQTYEKLSAATTEAAGLIENSYSTAISGVQAYQGKIFEFAQANTHAAFDFLKKMSRLKSPSEFLELSSEYARERREALTEQTQELAALAQKVSHASVEPLKTGVAKAFNAVP